MNLFLICFPCSVDLSNRRRGVLCCQSDNTDGTESLPDGGLCTILLAGGTTRDLQVCGHTMCVYVWVGWDGGGRDGSLRVCGCGCS